MMSGEKSTDITITKANSESKIAPTPMGASISFNNMVTSPYITEEKISSSKKSLSRT